MKKGYITVDGNKKSVTTEEYIKKEKACTVSCWLCYGQLGLCAETSVKIKTHFVHRHNSNCVTINKQYNVKYKSGDPEQAEKIKKEVKEHLSAIYKECKGIRGDFFYSHFSELLKKGSEKKIWQYASLKLKHIPYCLLNPTGGEKSCFSV